MLAIDSALGLRDSYFAAKLSININFGFFKFLTAKGKGGGFLNLIGLKFALGDSDFNKLGPRTFKPNNFVKRSSFSDQGA